MSRYALIEGGLVVEVRDMADNFDPSEVGHKFDWRLVVVQPDPVFDPLTHRIIRNNDIANWVFGVGIAEVTATRKVIPLTQDEIDAAALVASEDADREIAKALYADLVAGTGNSNQRIQRLEKVAARLLKDAYQ